jgi:3-dehydroquinate synthase
MALTCMIAEVLGLLRRREAELFVSLLGHLGIPAYSTLLTVDLCRAAARAATAHRGGKLHLVVPTRIGAAQFVEVEAVTEPVLHTALTRLRELLADLGAARSERFTGRAAQGMPDASPIL